MHAMHRSLGCIVALHEPCRLHDQRCIIGFKQRYDGRRELLPEWTVGQNWLYTFITPQFEKTARLVVAEIDNASGEYVLGISSERELSGMRLSTTIRFGRMTIDALAVYEMSNRKFSSHGKLVIPGHLHYLVRVGSIDNFVEQWKRSS